MNNKIRIIPAKINGNVGYDLEITDERATVQDYLDALNEAILKETFTRGRAKVEQCEGCDLCCAERVPLTWIDVLNLRKLFNNKDTGVENIVNKYGYVVVDGPVVDIMLRRDPDDRCRFLDRNKHLCTNYQFRPLVCQTFICCSMSKRAERLREVVVNKGEDELVRQWLKEARDSNKKPVIHEGYRPRPDHRDWPATPFAGCTDYKEVHLKDLCSKSLWKELYSKQKRGDQHG